MLLSDDKNEQHNLKMKQMNVSHLKLIGYLLIFLTFSLSAQNDWDTNTSGQITYSSGNIGIGTSSPDDLLDVVGSDTEFSIDNRRIELNTTDVTWDSYPWIGFYHDDVRGAFLGNGDPGEYIELKLENSTDFAIHGDGNVGIGTTTPEEALHVVGDVWVENAINSLEAKLYFGHTESFVERTAAELALTSSNRKLKLKARGTNSEIHFLTDDSERMLIDENGDVGIGTTNPASKIHVVQSNQNGIRLERAGHDSYDIRLAGSKGLRIFNTTDGEYEMVFDNGDIGIGTDSPTEKLEVNGTIRTKEVKVEASPWPDYVFEPDYELRSLEETEAFVKEHRHLPEIPSASELEANGLPLGEMNRLLMKKIEELTLHQIELLKLINSQNERIADLENKTK